MAYKSESRAAECAGIGVTASEIYTFGQRSEGKRSSFSCSPWGTGARSMIMFGGGRDGMPRPRLFFITKYCILTNSEKYDTI